MSNKSVRYLKGNIPLTEREKEDRVDIGLIALNSILECIRVGDKKYLEEYLSTIAIEQLSARDQLTLIDAILFQAYQVDDRDIPDFIFKYFDDRMGGITRLKTLPLYMMRGGLEDYMLAFIASSITFASFENFIHDLNTGETSQEVYEACVNAEKIFGQMNKETLMRLKIYLCADPLAKNYYLDKYVSMKLGDKEVLIAPKWIVDHIGDVVNHSDLSIPPYPNIKLRSPGKYAEEFIHKMKFKYKEDEDVLQTLKHNTPYSIASSTYAIMPLEEKVIMIDNLRRDKPIMISDESTKSDYIHFLTYGPNNVPHDLKVKRHNSDLPCMKSGGCRMFLCLCCESIDDNEDEEDVLHREDWFKGRCGVCSRIIERRHYAIRRPLPMGGWRGCFCSFECLNEDVNDPEDLVTPILISILTEFLFKIGIQERTYSDKLQTMK